MPPRPTSQRKERELQAREALIVSKARELLLERGFQAWNMDELAAAVEYSKGTLYLHFSTKEDLVLAVATAALKQRADLFEQASRFQGRTRERARAIGLACCEFAVSYPDYFHVEMMLKSVSFWEKASEARRDAHLMQGGRCWRILYNVVVEAMALGDLPRQPWSAEQATMSLISMTIGSHIMCDEGGLQTLAGISDPLAAVRQNQDMVLDGLGWQPLLTAFNYAATDQRILAEVFPSAARWLKL